MLAQPPLHVLQHRVFQYGFPHFPANNFARHILLDTIFQQPFGGHGKSLQGATSVSICSAPIPVISSEEVQLDPPFSGIGLEHVRVLSCVPPPHVFEQSVDGSHSPQFPSTASQFQSVSCSYVLQHVAQASVYLRLRLFPPAVPIP